MPKTFLSSLTPALGKAVRAAARLRSGGKGGTALPGRVVEAMDADFMARTLAQLPYGVVLVSGTNGKTTTTRIVSQVLEQLGLRVFTNPTGSNFTRGVVSALLDAVDMRGRLQADVAVLELDEAYAVHFVEKVKPRYALLLNVLRDQLDRFGEIDTTAKMLGAVAAATTGTVVLNREDPRVAALAELAHCNVAYYGLSDDLLSFFPSDDAMHAQDAVAANPSHAHEASVALTGLDGHKARLSFAGDPQPYEAELKLEGVYNAFNAAGALAMVREVMEADAGDLVRAVSTVTPAFGRGESIRVGEDTVELILVKNPMGFRLALKSFAAEDHETMIIINDEYADGRDMSWLWDVDFSSLQGTGVHTVAGVRATDMALRLAYDEVHVGAVQEDVAAAVKSFVRETTGRNKHIYCTYTAMLAARSAMAQIADVEDVGL
ncbi:Mur ligase family protein [Alloscardovia macacae]|uniref:Lipid II isoglutaminyl synthase (glutamine-hydrolyzing) subunit MurT n=1 Tax=Alloscardovia macacae TaxID=1160091 RepID=A0A261F6Q2_9BIFI|nr:Mur ligase family protein [Alloscardovia macacae]OZG54811.1 glutamate ligase [Alloscardovia macacae]